MIKVTGLYSLIDRQLDQFLRCNTKHQLEKVRLFFGLKWNVDNACVLYLATQIVLHAILGCRVVNRKKKKTFFWGGAGRGKISQKVVYKYNLSWYQWVLTVISIPNLISCRSSHLMYFQDSALTKQVQCKHVTSFDKWCYTYSP